METTKLYKSDVYIKEWEAHITSCEKSTADGISENEEAYLITLDKTAFFPEGGGQSCDRGFLGRYRVIDVQERDNQVYHTIVADKSADNSNNAPKVSSKQSFHCTLDWEHRFDNMQRHCGEHILSGIFYNLYGGVNRGFHMGTDYMTIDISLEENPEFTELTYDMALKAQLEANKVIWSNAPVTVMHFDTRAEAEKMPLRKALAFDEDITIVSVGSTENAADCVACCGTHPSTAGQVGLIKIFKVEKYKEMFRVYLEAGQRALADYDMKHNMLTGLSNSYSSSIEDFPGKLKSQEEKMNAVKNELFHLKKAFIENECDKLDAILNEASTSQNEDGSSQVIIYPLHHLSMDDAFNMAKNYMGKDNMAEHRCCRAPSLIMLYAKKDTSYILVSDGSIHCGKLVKEYASFYNGKGGGSDISARAIFTSSEDAALFADLIDKHLK